MENLTEVLVSWIDEEVNRLAAQLTKASDPVLIVLRFHLETERFLERILLGEIKRADRLLDRARLTYSQKPHLVHALDLVDDATIQALRKLNSLRNRCAHEAELTITVNEVEQIGRPMGKLFAELRRKYSSLPQLMAMLFARLGTNLLGQVARVELGEDR